MAQLIELVEEVVIEFYDVFDIFNFHKQSEICMAFIDFFFFKLVHIISDGIMYMLCIYLCKCVQDMVLSNILDNLVLFYS